MPAEQRRQCRSCQLHDDQTKIRGKQRLISHCLSISATQPAPRRIANSTRTQLLLSASPPALLEKHQLQHQHLQSAWHRLPQCSPVRLLYDSSICRPRVSLSSTLAARPLSPAIERLLQHRHDSLEPSPSHHPPSSPFSIRPLLCPIADSNKRAIAASTWPQQPRSPCSVEAPQAGPTNHRQTPDTAGRLLAQHQARGQAATSTGPTSKQVLPITQGPPPRNHNSNQCLLVAGEIRSRLACLSLLLLLLRLLPPVEAPPETSPTCLHRLAREEMRLHHRTTEMNHARRVTDIAPKCHGAPRPPPVTAI